ncbi:MAG: hypothetical protein RLY43_2437 [Bacteroidota bacterium]|jgi:hypothetical protein
MDKKMFFQKKNLFDNILKINSVGDYIWRHSWGHFEIVFLPILCIVAGLIYRIDKSNSISIKGLIIMFFTLFLGLLIFIKLIKSKSAIISRKVFYNNEDLLKSVYFSYVLIYYSISAVVFTLIYFVI